MPRFIIVLWVSLSNVHTLRCHLKPNVPQNETRQTATVKCTFKGSRLLRLVIEFISVSSAIMPIGFFYLLISQICNKNNSNQEGQELT